MFGRKIAMAAPEGRPLHIVITRISPRAFDSDNLVSSAKHVRDAIARILGVNDGDASAATWEVAWKKGKPKEFALEVAFEGPGG